MRTLDTLIVAPRRAGCKRYPSAMDWQALQDKFANLVAEEQAYYAGMGGRSMCAMGVYEDSDEFGRWTFSDAASERLLAQFQLLATEAGIALQPPPGILPVDYWLHSLRNHLRSTASHHTSIGDERGGPIMKVMEASALYCIRLLQKELETRHRTSGEHAFHVLVEALTGPAPQVVAAAAAPRLDLATAKDAHEVKPKANLAERQALRDSYFAGFAEKIAVLDVCWAAKQRYREWRRWLAGTLKDGSKPDRAFRAVLKSGKQPEGYRPEPRPKGWK